jgi:hypothetical protein
MVELLFILPSSFLLPFLLQNAYRNPISLTKLAYSKAAVMRRLLTVIALLVCYHTVATIATTEVITLRSEHF